LFEYARSKNLDDDLGAGLELRRVNLCDRCRGQGFYVKTLEYTLDRFPVGVVDDLDRLVGREWRDRVLELGEFVGDIRW